MQRLFSKGSPPWFDYYSSTFTKLLLVMFFCDFIYGFYKLTTRGKVLPRLTFLFCRETPSAITVARNSLLYGHVVKVNCHRLLKCAPVAREVPGNFSFVKYLNKQFQFYDSDDSRWCRDHATVKRKFTNEMVYGLFFKLSTYTVSKRFLLLEVNWIYN